MNEIVVLVDENDVQIGVQEKLAAHQAGNLHRAFSVFIFNSEGKLLLQQRALTKYHSPGVWTNTCCSHPRPGESVLEAAHRRLPEEMGFDCEVTELFTFTYRTPFTNGLTEYEYDHVLIGKYDKDPIPNPTEVEAFQWISLKELKQNLSRSPKHYSSWLLICFERLEQELEKHPV